MNIKDQLRLEKIAREARQKYFMDAVKYYDPLASFRVRARSENAERLRSHKDLEVFVGDRIYSVIQQFVGCPLDERELINVIQQTLLSIERIQGIRLQTRIFILLNAKNKSAEVKLGERDDLDNFYNLQHIKVIEVELPYERRKRILELSAGLPPIGRFPWQE